MNKFTKTFIDHSISMSDLNPYQLTQQLYQAFDKVKIDYNITNLHINYLNHDDCSLTASFQINDKSEYMHSYIRCIRVLQEIFKLGKFTHCMSQWTRWEKDGFEYNLQLTEWDCYNFPSTETQEICIRKINE